MIVVQISVPLDFNSKSIYFFCSYPKNLKTGYTCLLFKYSGDPKTDHKKLDTFKHINHLNTQTSLVFKWQICVRLSTVWYKNWTEKDLLVLIVQYSNGSLSQVLGIQMVIGHICVLFSDPHCNIIFQSISSWLVLPQISVVVHHFII